MKETKELYDVRYTMQMRGGFQSDVWRLQGILNGETRWTSTPVHYDRESRLLLTASGSRYQIMNFDGNSEEIEAQIESDIANKGFEVH